MMPLLASKTWTPAKSGTSAVKRPDWSTGTTIGMPAASHARWSSSPNPGAMWTVPVPSSLLRPGAIAAFAMVAALAWYWRMSRRLWVGIAIAFVLFAWIDWWIASRYGMRTLLYSGIGVFVVAWIGQFIGHVYEGHRPSFFTDLVFLLVGPMWTLRKLYQRLGLGY